MRASETQNNEAGVAARAFRVSGIILIALDEYAVPNTGMNSSECRMLQ